MYTPGQMFLYVQIRLFCLSFLCVQKGGPRDVVSNMLDCDIIVKEFKLQSRCYVDFRRS